MGFNISFGSETSGLNIGFGNQNNIDVEFNSRESFNINQDQQDSINASFDSSNPLNIGFNSSEQMNADFSTNGIIYYDTEENWNRQITLMSVKKVIYIYSDHTIITSEIGESINIPALKIGDGVTLLINLPFVSDDIRINLMKHINNLSMHVSENERSFWSNKVGAYVLTNRPKTLILSKVINM